MSVKILENRLKTILEKRGLLWPPESFSKFHITCCKIGKFSNI